MPISWVVRHPCELGDLNQPPIVLLLCFAVRSIILPDDNRERMTSRQRLRIAIVADPEIPVPPKFYGGVERRVDMLARALVERSHDVTLFAHPNSQVPCRLEPYPGRSRHARSDVLRNMWHVSSRVLRFRCDLVHIFGRLAYVLPLLPMQIPKLMSYGGIITPRSVAWGERLARRTLHFTARSCQMIDPYKGRGNWHVVYHGVPLTTYQFRHTVDEDAPLVFLGRIEEIKGPHLAIEVARRCARTLVLAGGPQDQIYFQEKIAPHIDGKAVQYLVQRQDEIFG